ncbi:GNAT family N-acetyltransferase [Flaviramulus sp. BrNp1-15]|uniref:GNAT family N-acetyltransferase n=1 Tax=Flaviramulus sp. BrNp1-15 TaxID=2916754 RepID=UPI001EE803EA|nr:GNAT family N-acetyltransferase [Flaviramulus sp. BrNp1-15]ULC60819.1 GNAT family N-acetyltransferase [Flaviramulus sp. BrNp1-15]
MIEIQSANNKPDYLLIEQLADTIWREHYPTIISIEQIDYMLAKFNSAKAIESQINEGSQFYYMVFNRVPAGYLAIKNEDDFLFLSKLYVKKEFRGKKIGKAALQFIDEEAKRYNLKSIQLKVNKYNTKSILAYEKLGFKKVKAMITDIGKGFIMDDYLLEKIL